MKRIIHQSSNLLFSVEKDSVKKCVSERKRYIIDKMCFSTIYFRKRYIVSLTIFVARLMCNSTKITADRSERRGKGKELLIPRCCSTRLPPTVVLTWKVCLCKLGSLKWSRLTTGGSSRDGRSRRGENAPLEAFEKAKARSPLPLSLSVCIELIICAVTFNRVPGKPSDCE